MRLQVFGMHSALKPNSIDLAKVQACDIATSAELSLIEYLHTLISCLKWEDWSRCNVQGFRSVTSDNFVVTIRRFSGSSCHPTMGRWLDYRINPRRTPHWYHFMVRDPFARHGKKEIIDYAATLEDCAYDPLRNFHTTLQEQGRAERQAEPLPVQASNLSSLALECVRTNPMQKR